MGLNACTFTEIVGTFAADIDYERHTDIIACVMFL
jgi:hypothetical protein